MSKKIITITLIVFFSVMMWIFVALSEEYFYTIKLPVKFSGIPENLAVSNYSNNEVTISFKGQGWQLAQMTLGGTPDFIINVEGTTGEHKISVRNALDQNRWLFSALQINEFSPNEIKYNVEEVAKKKVAIDPNIIFNFKEGYGQIGNTKANPESVIIRGPESLIENLTKVKTEQKTYYSLDEGKTEYLKLEPVNNIEFDNDRVQVSFEVQKIVDREFQNILVEVKNIPPSKNLTVYPERINVILRGGINLLGKLDPNEIKVSINYNQAIKDTLGFLIPNVEVPELTQLVDTKPNKLEYIIQQL